MASLSMQLFLLHERALLTLAHLGMLRRGRVLVLVPVLTPKGPASMLVPIAARPRACAARGRLLKGGHAVYLETVPLRTVAAFTGLQALLLLVVYVRAPGARAPAPARGALMVGMSGRPAPELPRSGRLAGQHDA